MQEVEEFMKLAKEAVDTSNYSFLKMEDIINNFRDNGFLVNQNTMIGYTSYLEYDREKKRGIISYTIDVSLKMQKKILLRNYAAFLLNQNSKMKFYYKDMPTRRIVDRFAKCLIEESCNKEFPADIEDVLENKQEGRVRK